MIRAHQPRKPERDIRLPEAMGLLLSALAQWDSQLSATDDSLIASADGEEIISFVGRGDDFERFKRFCLKIMPMVVASSHKRREVVLRILCEYFEIKGKPIEVPLEIPNFDNKVQKSVQEALEKRQTGEDARAHFVRWFENFRI